jgi:hypothetical protein
MIMIRVPGMGASEIVGRVPEGKPNSRPMPHAARTSAAATVPLNTSARCTAREPATERALVIVEGHVSKQPFFLAI